MNTPVQESSPKFTSPFGTTILGSGSAFPARKLTNDDLSKMVDTNNEWILERTGIRERRISEPGNPAERNSSLGHRAAINALEMARRRPEDIDMILYATCTPDTLIPSTACWLQHKLGAKRAWVLDINAACSGFVYGMSIADQFIKSGSAKTALIIGAEVVSTFVNWEDRGSCILFGDAAGAMVVERCANDAPNRIFSSHLQGDGDLWEVFHMPAGGSAIEVTHGAIDQRLNKMAMKGKEIFKVAVKTLADFATRALEANGVTAEQVDWIVPHQANLRIIEAVAKRLNFPMSKVIVNVDRYGNTSAATVPTAFDEAVRDGRIKKGQLVLFDVFGAGLTYGSMLLRV